MDFRPDHVSNRHGDARSSLVGSAASHRTSSFANSGSSQNDDPQIILNSLYSTSVEHRGHSMDGSHMDDWEDESVS